MNTDFDKWLLQLGINATKQPRQQKALLIILEGLFDLTIDLQKRIEFLERHWK